jgi:hypothetical protein
MKALGLLLRLPGEKLGDIFFSANFLPGFREEVDDGLEGSALVAPRSDDTPRGPRERALGDLIEEITESRGDSRIG